MRACPKGRIQVVRKSARPGTSHPSFSSSWETDSSGASQQRGHISCKEQPWALECWRGGSAGALAREAGARETRSTLPDSTGLEASSLRLHHGLHSCCVLDPRPDGQGSM